MYLIDFVRASRARAVRSGVGEQSLESCRSSEGAPISLSAADYLIELSAWSAIFVVLPCDHDVQAMKTALPNQTVDWTG